MMNKKLYLFLALAAINLLVNAQSVGKVIIRNNNFNYPKFMVSLNGVRINDDYLSQVNFNYLDERTYRVKVLQAGSSNELTFMLTSEINYVSTYVLIRDNMGKYTLMLESKMIIPEPIQPSDPLKNVNLTGTMSVTPNTATVVAATVATVVPVVATPTAPPAPQAMGDTEYREMLASVKKEALERTKLEMAQTFFGSQNLSSFQVLGILKVFSLESSRLAFAKFAYPLTIDKNSYHKVFDAFSLSSSKRDLSEFMKNNK